MYSQDGSTPSTTVFSLETIGASLTVDDTTVDDGGPSCVGCTDPMACNYDNEATVDDGSCEMPDVCGDCSEDTYTFYLNPGGNLYGGEEVSHVEMTVGETFEVVDSYSNASMLASKVSSVTYYTVDGLRYSFTRPDNFSYDSSTATSPVYPEWLERTKYKRSSPNLGFNFIYFKL